LQRQQIISTDTRLMGVRLVLPGRLRARAELLAVAGIALVVAFLVFTNVSSYPTISGWDEGLYLQFAHNFGHYGEYATTSGGTFDRLVPAGGTGPTLVAPVGLALRLSGDSLTAARLIVGTYLLIALVGAYLLVRYIGGRWAALAALPLFLAAGFPPYNTLWMGRQVLAEIPALAFTFLGMWAWCKSWRGKTGWLITSSLLIALAVITKNQLIWTLGPSFALFGVVDRLYYRQLHWRYSLAPLAGVVLGYGSWFLVSLWIAGSADRAIFLDAQKALTGAVFFHVGPHRWLQNARYFGSRIDLVLLTVGALGYGVFRARERTLAGLQRLVLPLFAGLVLASFLALSLPWPRYIYPALALVSLCAALLVSDLAQWVNARWSTRSIGVAAPLFIAVILLTSPTLVRTADRIVRTDDTSAMQFAALIDKQVPMDASILDWEFEVEFYSRHTFVHPPANLFAALIDQTYNDRSAPILEQRRIPEGINYVIVGPFAGQTGVFLSELAQRNYRVVAIVGPYQLYGLPQ
jgi:hypothetical protein